MASIEVDIATRCQQLSNDVPMWQLTELMDEFKVGVIARIKVEPIDPKDWQLAADTCFAFLEKPTLAPLDQAQVHFILAGMCLNGDIAVQEDHLIIADDILTWSEKEVAVGGCGAEIGRYSKSLRRRHRKLSYAILDALIGSLEASEVSNAAGAGSGPQDEDSGEPKTQERESDVVDSRVLGIAINESVKGDTTANDVGGTQMSEAETAIPHSAVAGQNPTGPVFSRDAIDLGSGSYGVSHRTISSISGGIGRHTGEQGVGGQDVEKQDTEKQSVGEHDVGKQSAEGQSAEGQRVEDNGTGEQGAGNDSAGAQYSSEEVPRNTAASADAIIEETAANQDAAANTVLDDQGFSDHGAVVGTDALDALDAKDDGAEHPGGSTKLPVRKKTISKSVRRREANDAFAERNTSKQLKGKAQQKRDVRSLWPTKSDEV